LQKNEKEYDEASSDSPQDEEDYDDDEDDDEQEDQNDQVKDVVAMEDIQQDVVPQVKLIYLFA
jgi:hypothetical protein